MPTSVIAGRLERLPFSRSHFYRLCIGGLGFAFEAVKAAIIAFLMPEIHNPWRLSSVETGSLGSSTYVGVLIGALLTGLLGDRCGRRTVMMSALDRFCLASPRQRTTDGDAGQHRNGQAHSIQGSSENRLLVPV